MDLQLLKHEEIKVISNYRKTFDERALAELASSVKENGVLEPIVVRQNGTGFELISGERRVRAAKMAGLRQIPAVVRECTDLEFQKFQLIENIQREDVPFMEEAFGLKALRDRYALDVTEIQKMVGKSDVYVYQLLKLTEMSEPALTIARDGKLLKSVAILISQLKNEDDQNQMAIDLGRERGELVSLKTARTYAQTFGVNRKQQNRIQKINGHDYKANWKKYLVEFDCKQFSQFKEICRGRTETEILAEAVEGVMLEQ